MKIDQLRELISQLINETLTELSPKTLSSYIGKADTDRRDAASDAFGVGKDVASDTARTKAYQRLGKRTRGIATATDKIQAQKRGQTPAAAATPRVKNPATGEEILATTAYKAGPTHPAYAAAKSALKKEIAVRKQMNESKKPIRLTDLLMENAERRVNLMKIQTIMEKLYPELTDTQSKKLMELCTEVHMMTSQMNTIPYIRTESSLVEWTILVAAFKAKVTELKEEVVKVCEDKKIDCTTAVKALDEVLTY